MSFRGVSHDPRSPRESVRVARVAQILDCDESQIRRLLRKGELEAHRQGVRGVRIYLDSVRSYQERRPIEAAAVKSPPTPKLRKRSQASEAAHEAAMAELKALKLI